MVKGAKKPMLPWYRLALYGSGSLSFGIMQHTVSGLIMFFGIVAHNIMGTLMGVICAFAMLAAAIMDPIARNISDNTNSRLLGKRHGYILSGVFLVALLNIAIWSMPASFPVWLKFMWLFAGVIAMEVMNSFIQTPYNALGNELAGSANERENIQRFRYFCVMLGLIVPVVLMGVFLKDKTNIFEYRTMAAVGSTVVLLSGLAVFFGTYSHLPRLRAKSVTVTAESKTIAGIFREFFQVIKIKNFRALLLGYAIAFMSVAFLTTIGLFFFQYTMGYSFQLIAILISIVFLFLIISEPMWKVLAVKTDKRSALLVSMSFMFIGTIYITLIFVLRYYLQVIDGIDFWLFVPGMVFVGIGAGGMFTLPRYILNDLLNEHYKVKNNAASGLLNFSYKLATSLTALIVGIALDIAQFSSKSAAAGLMSGYTYGALGWILVAGILISTLTALILFGQYGKKNDANTSVKKKRKDA